MDTTATVDLRWNDPATILAGGHWSLERHDTGERHRAALHAVIGLVGEEVGDQCVAAHVDFIGALVAAADDLHASLVEALGEETVDDGHGRFQPDSPIGSTCRRAAAALDVAVYDLGRGLTRLGRRPDAATGEAVLAAAHASLYLRSLIGLHEPPLPPETG